jgi:RHS repeat-associated protein
VEERVGGSGSADRQFVWGLRALDDLVLRDYGSQRMYAMHDYFNCTAIADTTGTVQERYGYNGFGQANFMTSSFGSVSGSSYGWETLFANYRWDSETGLYQVRYRYQHPGLGRWLSRDPIAERGGLNLYGFVHESPIDFVDVLGLASGYNRPPVGGTVYYPPVPVGSGYNPPPGIIPGFYGPGETYITLPSGVQVPVWTSSEPVTIVPPGGGGGMGTAGTGASGGSGGASGMPGVPGPGKGDSGAGAAGGAVAGPIAQGGVKLSWELSYNEAIRQCNNSLASATSGPKCCLITLCIGCSVDGFYKGVA